MPKKNDLSALKVTEKKPLLAKEKAPVSKAGRKKKPVEEKESETVVLKLTIAERENLEAKAGLVPLGTFVKHHLRTETDLLND